MPQHMPQHLFISTGNVKLEQAQSNLITLESFAMWVGLDLAIVIGSFIGWKILWYGLDLLEIKDIVKNQRVVIGSGQPLIYIFSCLKNIVKNLANLNCYIIHQCGFEAYTYLFFLRRMTQLMGVLLISDICIWIPYQFLFLPPEEFSLITMTSKGSDLFRTYYMIWVCLILLYGLHNLKELLRIQLKFLLLHETHKTYSQRMLNNLKTKTIHIHFCGKQQNSEEIRQRIIEGLKIQDRILAVRHIPNYSDRLQVRYKTQMVDIVKQVGTENMSPIWRCLKFKQYQEIQQNLEEDKQKALNAERQSISSENKINSYFIAFENIQTAQKLVKQFQTNKALFDFLPQIGYSSYDITVEQSKNRIIAKWAQQPNDIMWINMKSHQAKVIKYVFYNFLCVLLMVVTFLLIAFANNTKIFIIQIPKALFPFVLVIINSLLRFLISKTTQWQNKILRSQTQIKQFKVIAIYFVINVLLGSIVRDTLNLLDILQTGWGFIQLFGLIYRKVDGLFYYLFIMNQTAISFFVMLMKMGQMFPDVYQCRLYFLKVTRVRQLSAYAQNDCFRFGYYYAYNYIVIIVILLFSTTCPLIHFFGLIFFISRLYLDTYDLTVFHKNEETASNLRLIVKVLYYIYASMLLWMFLTAMTMMTSPTNSNALVLYISMTLIIFYMFMQSRGENPLKDAQSDEQLDKANLELLIRSWKETYAHPLEKNPLK